MHQHKKIKSALSHLSFGSLDHIIPQNHSMPVPQPTANIINLTRVDGAWKEATPTKERTRQKAIPWIVPEKWITALIPVNIGERIVTTNAS